MAANTGYFTKDALYCAEFGFNSEFLYTFTFSGKANEKFVKYLRREHIAKSRHHLPIIRLWGEGTTENTSRVAEWDNSSKKWIEKDISYGDEKYKDAFRIQEVGLPNKGETYTAVFDGPGNRHITFTYGDNHQTTMDELKSQFPEHPADGIICIRLRHVFYESGDHFYLYMFWENGRWSHTEVRMEDESTFNEAIILFYEKKA